MDFLFNFFVYFNTRETFSTGYILRHLLYKLFLIFVNDIFQAQEDQVITLNLKMLNFGSASYEEERIVIYEGQSTH